MKRKRSIPYADEKVMRHSGVTGFEQARQIIERIGANAKKALTAKDVARFRQKEWLRTHPLTAPMWKVLSTAAAKPHSERTMGVARSNGLGLVQSREICRHTPHISQAASPAFSRRALGRAIGFTESCSPVAASTAVRLRNAGLPLSDSIQ